jgi:serine/threonine protein kinase
MDRQVKRDRAANIGDEALDVDAGPQRDALIEGQCAGDPELAAYVREYLAGFKEVFSTKHQVFIEPKKPAERVQIKLKRYKLARVLGAGGMGKVFKAIDIETNQPVAIKFISGPHAGNENMRMRLVREARAAGALHHPNIVAVSDIGQVKGSLYIVMDYVRGNTLANLIAGVAIKISLKSRLRIMAQIADALAYAHTQGVIHRDIKPANVIVRSDGSVKVVDFGIAEQADLQNSLVQGAGTIPYMSPEQLGGQDLDARSDIWSTGITLFELLTGYLPYRSVEGIRSAPVPILPQAFPLSSQLNAVLALALAKDRQMRYRKAEDLADDLRRLLQMCEMANLSAQSGDTSAQVVHTTVTVGNYILPNLNFSCPFAGELGTMVVMRKGKEKAQSLHLSYRNFSQEIALLMRRANSSAVSLILGVINLIAWLQLNVMLAICYLLDGTERLPSCRSCRLRMKGTARWTRLVMSKEEVIFGYRDCMSALRNGLWQEAAKLLNIHGAETVSKYSHRFITPARYHLDYFECALCSHHAARLTVDEMIEGKWRQQAKFGEAYWGSVGKRPSVLARLSAAPRAYLRMLNVWLRPARR